MQAFQRDLEKFKSLGTQVLGVSPDSLETHKEFKKKNRIEFPLISDAGGELRKLYSGGRVTFVIDREGTIRFIQKGVPDNQKLLKAIEEFGR